jgi:hypothetical protein
VEGRERAAAKEAAAGGENIVCHTMPSLQSLGGRSQMGAEGVRGGGVLLPALKEYGFRG